MTAIQQSGYRENLLFCTLGIFEGFFLRLPFFLLRSNQSVDSDRKLPSKSEETHTFFSWSDCVFGGGKWDFVLPSLSVPSAKFCVAIKKQKRETKKTILRRGLVRRGEQAGRRRAG